MKIVRGAEVGINVAGSINSVEFEQKDAISPRHLGELTGEVRGLGTEYERFGWMDQSVLPRINTWIVAGVELESDRFKLDIQSLHSRIGFTSLCRFASTSELNFFTAGTE